MTSFPCTEACISLYIDTYDVFPLVRHLHFLSIFTSSFAFVFPFDIKHDEIFFFSHTREPLGSWRSFSSFWLSNLKLISFTNLWKHTRPLRAIRWLRLNGLKTSRINLSRVFRQIRLLLTRWIKWRKHISVFSIEILASGYFFDWICSVLELFPFTKGSNAWPNIL